MSRGSSAIRAGNDCSAASIEISSGLCLDDPCKGERLERIEAFVDGEDVCITGVDLVEEDGLDRDENDENPEVVILPD